MEKQAGDKVSIKELSDLTAIKGDDIIQTLNHHGLLQYDRGQHVIISFPQTLAGSAAPPPSVALSISIIMSTCTSTHPSSVQVENCI